MSIPCYPNYILENKRIRMSLPTERERVEDAWREKLHEAESARDFAFAQTRQIQAELPFRPPSDGHFALRKALRCQDHALHEYTRVLEIFTRLILHGELPKESVEPEQKEPKE